MKRVFAHGGLVREKGQWTATVVHKPVLEDGSFGWQCKVATYDTPREALTAVKP